MKNFLTLLVLFTSFQSYSQTDDDIKYRRSSLHLMMMEDAKLPEKDIIINTFNTYPFPDKYNDHKIDIIRIPNFLTDDAEESKKELKAQKEADKESGVKITAEQKERRKLIKSLKGADKTIEKYFNDNKVANKMVAKWFDMQADGNMNLKLIAERGQYDATSLDVKKAGMMDKTVSTQLQDAGVELMDKSFVIINKFRFISNEIAAAIAYEIAKATLANMKASTKLEQTLKNTFEKKSKQLYEKARKGYTVGTQAILYKLNWSDSVQAIFWQQYYMPKERLSTLSDSLKAVQINKFNNSDLFQLELVGMEKQTIRVLNLTSEDLNKQQIIGEATRRTMNKVYAKLQKEYEVFKPRMPLLTASKKDCTAKIGKKEGLEGGEKFDVLEKSVDKDGLTVYKKKAVIKVDKKQLWDNQFYAANPPEQKGKKGPITATGFKGCKNSFYKGMLIKQIK
ncbi:MAG: hypothetical protein P8J77_03285 [Flavobacteriales bacterium]|nr:hypothetical protein [Flavobacteriales bacterium]